MFPFVNSVFRLPYFTNTSLIDARFKAPFTWKTPYEETGRGGRDSPNVPGGIELGLRNPSLRNIARIAHALGISVAELFQGK